MSYLHGHDLLDVGVSEQEETILKTTTKLLKRGSHSSNGNARGEDQRYGIGSRIEHWPCWLYLHLRSYRLMRKLQVQKIMDNTVLAGWKLLREAQLFFVASRAGLVWPRTALPSNEDGHL